MNYFIRLSANQLSYMQAFIRVIFRKLIDKLRGEPNLLAMQRRGLTVGKNFKIMSECRIDYSHCWHITIGDNVTLAPRVHILAHDASTHTHLGYTKIGNVRIGNNVFIGAGSVILLNVNIGDDCIIGAGSVVSRSVPSGYVAAGNPARVIMTTTEYIAKQQGRMQTENCFDESYTIRQNISVQQQQQMVTKAAEQGIAFVE